MSHSTDKSGDSAERLTALREEIDAVDTALHDLVMRRAEITHHMGALKGAPAGEAVTDNPIRPAREAAILRRLAARHSGPSSFAVVVQIWRELIAANLRRQCQFSLAVLESGDAALWDTARAAFGALTPAAAYFRPQDVIDAIAAAPGTLGILPAPDNAPPEFAMWPELLTDKGAPRILFALPALTEQPWPRAFAVGHAPAEPSGDDFSFVLLTGTSPSPGAHDLAAAGLAGRVAACWPAFVRPGLYCSFVMTEGFMMMSDPALARLDEQRRREGGHARLIGSAPGPIRPPEE